MDDNEHLDEPPPVHRRARQVETGNGLLTEWLGRPSGAHRGVDLGRARRTGTRKRILLGLGCLAVLCVQAWMVNALVRARTDLVHVSKSLEDARSSLGLVWESTKRLDQDQMTHLALLADSIRSVSDYTQGEMRLWETTYANLQHQMEENFRKGAKTDTAILRSMTTAMRGLNTRLEVFARTDQEQRGRLDALDRSQALAVEALARRTQTQESTMHDVSATVGTLRETLGKLDSDLETLDQRLAASSSQYGQLGRRVETLSGWAEGFRRAGLSGDAVQGQLTALADELRRVRVRVDSLRAASRPMISASLR